MNPTVTPQPSTPNSPRVRVEGTLDMVRASDQTFTLRLPDGSELPGRLARGTIAGLGRVLGRRLIMFGTARVSPAGEFQLIEADGYLPNDGKPWRHPKKDPPLSAEVTAEFDRRIADLPRTHPHIFAAVEALRRLTPPTPPPNGDTGAAISGPG